MRAVAPNTFRQIEPCCRTDAVGRAVLSGAAGQRGDGTGGNQKRIALSPYASFGITLPAKFNPGVDFSKATGIEIHFSGYAVPRLNMKVHG